MSDCVVAITTAQADGSISDSQARELLQRMENMARARAAQNSISINQALRDIAGEMRAGQHSQIQIDLRNRLLSLAKFKEKVQAISASKNWGKEFRDRIVRTSDIGRRLEKQYASRLAAFLEENKLTDTFRRGERAKEFYVEMWNVESGGAAPVGDEGMYKLAQFYNNERKARVAKKNLHGAYIAEPAGPYGMLQSYSTDRVRALGGAMDDGNKMRARQAFFNLVAGVGIDPRTYDGRDAAKFWGDVFDNLYHGNHAVLPDKVDIDRYAGAHGSLANKLSESRLIWFADGESQWRWNQEIGAGNYHEIVMREINTSAKSIALMTEWGPNWHNTTDLVNETLGVLAKDEATAKQTDSLKAFDLPGYRRLLSGESEISNRPTLSKWVKNLMAWTHTAKMGSATIASFPDIILAHNQLAMNGMGALEAVGRVLDGYLGKSFEKQSVLRSMAVVSHSFIGSLQSRFGVDGVTGFSARASHLLNELNLFNKWNDSIMEGVTFGLSHWLGEHSHFYHAALPELLRAKLSSYGIGPVEWNAVRSVADHVADAAGAIDPASAKFVLLDRIGAISDAHMDEIAAARGLVASGPNRARIRDDLDIKLGTYFSNEADAALSVPDLRTRHLTTGGAMQAGTLPREAMNLLMMFKSFPLSVAMRFGQRAEQAGIENLWSVKQWAQHPGFAFRQASIIAAASVAGYLAMTTRDLLTGRTRRSLFDDEGNPNVTVFLDAMAKGGGIGMMGDFLFSEYDRQYKSVLSYLAGPVLGQLDPIGALATGARALALGQETKEHPAAEAFQLAVNNLPFANLFYVKPIMNAFLWWNIRDALSPGVLQRAERNARDLNFQETIVSPAEIGAIPITEPGRKAAAILDSLTK